MALLDVINATCDELGVNRCNTPIMSQSDRQTLQFLALLKRLGYRELPAAWDWEALITSTTVTTVASQASYSLPADFANFIDDTQWFTTSKVPLWGPLNQPDWARNEFGMTSVGPYYRFQIRGGALLLQPTPTTAGQTVNYYYLSNAWIRPAGSTTASRVASFTADTDTFVFDEPLLISGLVYLWKRAKGFDFSAEQDAYEALLNVAKCNDRGVRSLSMDPEEEVQGMQTGFIVPITGFGS